MKRAIAKSIKLQHASLTIGRANHILPIARAKCVDVGARATHKNIAPGTSR